MKIFLIAVTGGFALASACKTSKQTDIAPDAVKPVVVTEKVVFDTDDPAIWINKENPATSVILGTDKETDGGLYVFDLQGKIINKVTGLKRPNNVDIAYDISLGGKSLDVAVTTERETNKLRFFSVPELAPLDEDGIEVFTGEAERGPMGVAFYRRPTDSAFFVIVGRKTGPAEGYLWQYKLVDDNGKIALQLARKFGRFSGKKEIEAIAVDQSLGYVYYSDEQVGIRKYHADPNKGNEELTLFGEGDYKADNEGISIYALSDSTGYILVSNQSNSSFNVYPREGAEGNPHLHQRITEIPVSTLESDGSDVSSVSLPGFEGGIFVAMSADKTFQYYRWVDISEKGKLKTK
ncbi:MAG: phytase [Chitinophagaceae bacterium]|nr:phytase [Chitinophagaceae bacterium]